MSREAERYEVIVIGTGQAGKPLAGAFAEAGRRTAVIEKGRVGGTCVVEGCTPTKTMVASARVAYLAGRGAEYGVRTGQVGVDMSAVRERKREMVDRWSAGSRRGMERHDEIDLIFGTARFTGAQAVAVATSNGEERLLTAELIFINAGARPAVPPIPGLDEVEWLDSTSVMEVGEVPGHLVVLGGGFIGLEFGQMFRRFGSDVTVVEMAPRLVAREDEDVSQALAEIFREDGIRVLTETTVERVAPGKGGVVRVGVAGVAGTETLEATHLLVAAGRVPNTDLLDVGSAGIRTDARGFIEVNDRLETNVPGVYALGDINGGPPFTHVAYDDYRIMERIHLEGGEASRSGRVVPYTLFTDPELGRIGLTEAEARERGHDVRVAKLPMSRVARAIESGETRGFMKAIVDGSTDRILGASILGVQGGEVATALQLAMMGELPYTALRDAIFSHPTMAESLNNLFATLDA